jgi:hypothetical protein
MATIQNVTELLVGPCNIPPTAIAAMLHVVMNSDCSGSNHQFIGFLSNEGRRNFSPLHYVERAAEKHSYTDMSASSALS